MHVHMPQAHVPVELGASVPHRGVELPAAVAITWSLAGGMLWGGMGVVTRLASGSLSGERMLGVSALLFSAGAAVGLVHGVAVGILGRSEGTSVGDALKALLHGMLYFVPALLLGWLVAGWVAAMPLALAGDHLIGTGVSAVAWAVMAVAVFFASSTGWKAVRLALRRWPNRAAGTALVLAVFAGLGLDFVVREPALPFSGARLTPTGSVVASLVAALWLYGPVVAVGLRLQGSVRRGDPRAGGASGSSLRAPAVSAALALCAGVGVAATALPFYLRSAHLPSDFERLGPAGALTAIVSGALTGELLLRLLVVTAAFAVASRLLAGRRSVALALAIGLAAMLDVALRWPGMAALGFPSAVTLVAYAAVRGLIPAVIYGYLFWSRGIVTAVGAHVAAGVALGMVAL